MPVFSQSRTVAKSHSDTFDYSSVLGELAILKIVLYRGVQYDVSVSQAKFPDSVRSRRCLFAVLHAYFDGVFQPLECQLLCLEDQRKDCEERYRKNIVRFNVYFERMTSIIYEEHPSYQVSRTKSKRLQLDYSGHFGDLGGSKP